MALPSVTIVITAEEKAAADTRLPISSKSRRKRRMAGYQVEQTVEACRSLPSHQQQPEHRTVPAIKLRRVTDDQSWVVSSPSEETTPEPMEAKPALAMSRDSRTVAVVRPMPQSSPINQANVIIENAQMEPGVSEMATSSRQNPVIQSATISYRETMEHFDPEHYDQLVDKFDKQEYPLEILEAATQVLETCKKRAIKVKATLFSMLKFHVISRHHSDLKKFYEKCNVFFGALNLDVAKDTACLTSMLNKSRSSNIATISNSFINMGDTEIQYIAKSPWLKNISSICNGKGLPKEADVEAFLKLPCLKEGWQGNDEAVQDKPLDRALVTNISSMCHCKGLPKEADVKAFLKLACLKEGWQGNDEAVQDKPLDRALVANLSSMCHCKGLPKEADVKAFLQLPCLKEGWQGNDEAVQDKPLDRALVTNISSMCSSKGFPREADVKAFLKLPCLKQGWQGNDETVNDKPLDRALVTNMSSMCNGKGLPKEADVKAFLKLPCLKEGWQGNDVAVKDKPLDRALVTNISSMCHGKGLPKEADVKAFLKLPCLKQGWQGNDETVNDKPLDRVLVTNMSSMCSGKGFPREADVKAFLKLPCLKQGWQGNDETVNDKPLDRALVTNMSSMFNGKGLPKEADVKAFLKLPCMKEGWQDNDEPVQDKRLDRALVTNISSMCNGKGLPKEADVKAFLKLPCMKEGWQDNDEPVQDKRLDRALVTNISSMCNGKGLPKEAGLKAFLKLSCLKEGWQGNDEAVKDKPLDRSLVINISSMCTGKGLPKEANVKAFVQWLPSDEKKNFLKKLACRIFAGCGLPEQETLAKHEKIICHYFTEKLTNSGDVGSITANSRACLLTPESREHNEWSSCLPGTGSEYSTDNGYDSSDTDNDLPEAFQIKALTLFCVAPAKWRMAIAEFDQYLTAHKRARSERTAILSALESLLLILANHGGPGVRFWLEKHYENLHGKEKLTKALSIPAPREQTKFALTQLPESQWQEYIELCKNLKPAPDKAQWDALKPIRQQLDQRFKLTPGKRMMLEILWPQSWQNRSGYAGQMDRLFKAVPTISQLHRIHRAYKPQKMKDFLDACLAWQGTREKVPKVRIQERLLEGILLANHHLDGQGDIPDLCFSKRVSTDSGKGVIVDGDCAMAGQERLWHFIAAMLIELEQTEYEFKKQRLTVLSPDGKPVVLPKPEFALTGTGFVIKNWSPGQLTAFFQATEFTEQWYEKPHDKRQPCTIRLEAKLVRMKAGSKENAHNKDKKTTPLLLAPSIILNLINSKRPLKPAVWKSIEHYAKNGQLTARLCKALAPVIDNEPEGIVPDVVKNTVTATLPQIQEVKAPEVRTNTLAPALTLQPPISVGIQGTQATFDTAMKALDRFQVLEKAELEMLESHRNRMTFIQLMSVITKISDSVDAQTQIQWYIACEHRRKDPLRLEIWEQDWLSASEPHSQEQIEELRQ